jgi:hypothetical protein
LFLRIVTLFDAAVILLVIEEYIHVRKG